MISINNTDHLGSRASDRDSELARPEPAERVEASTQNDNVGQVQRNKDRRLINEAAASDHMRSASARLGAGVLEVSVSGQPEGSRSDHMDIAAMCHHSHGELGST